MAKSTRAQSRRATGKARFPLWLHPATGQWCKVHKGKRFYFGTDQDEALARYLAEKADIEAGRTPQARTAQDAESVDLRMVANHFLALKKHLADAGEITRRSFQDYYDTCERLLNHFGKQKRVAEMTSADLLAYRTKLAETRGAHALGNEIQRVRTVLAHAFNEGLVDKPVRIGSSFAKPTRRAYRQARADAGERLFTPSDLKRIIDGADPIQKAMLLLALNAGLGNSDIGQLRTTAVDWSAGWLSYPRPKTGVFRRAPLWPETLAALKKARDLRPLAKAPEDDGLLFLTRCGVPWHRDTGGRSSPLSAEFRKLLVKLKIYRPGLSFYTLRHQFQTLADETGDETATRMIMGHTDGSVSAVYRERFPDERLQRVVDHVRSKVLASDDPQSKGGDS